MLKELGRPDEHPDTLPFQEDIAMALLALEQAAAAEKELRSVLAARERVLVPDHPLIDAARYHLALCREKQQYPAEALELAQ